MPLSRRRPGLRHRFAALAAPVALAVPVAAAALDGQVLLADGGTPVAHAEVTVIGRTGTVRTGADGSFRLTPDPEPPFEVLVVLPGERYMKPHRVEALPASGPLVVRVSPLVMQEVTVTAGAAPDIDASPAAAGALVARADLEARAPHNLVEAIEQVPGVGRVSEGQAAVPAVRGLARGRTLLLVDGARVTSERRVGPSATWLDPFALDGVQVSRGPGSVAYGSDALGGVIHARSRRAEPGSGFHARLTAALGTGEPERRANVELSHGWSGGGAIVQARWRELSDYRSPHGEVFNSSFRDAGVQIRADRPLLGGLLSAGWHSDFARDVGRPRTNSRTVRFYYPLEDSHRLTASYDAARALGLDRLALSAFLGRTRQVTDQDRLATPAAPRRIERADVEARDFQLRAVGEKLAGNARVGFGLDVNGRFDLHAEDLRIEPGSPGGGSARVAETTVEDAQRTDAGAFVSLTAAVDRRLTLAAAGRLDRVTTSNRGGWFGARSTGSSALSGYAAASLGLGRGFALTAQVARGFRDPTLSDRYFRGVTGRGFLTGNPDLEPETSLQFDAALAWTGPAVRAGLFGFSYRIDDLVERFEDGDDRFFFRNRGRARLRGLELELQAELPGAVTLDLGLEHQRGRTPDDGRPLDDIAPTTVSLQVRRAIGGRAFLQLRGVHEATDRRPGPTEVATPAHTRLDLAAGWRVDSRLELRLLGRNLLDESYPASPDSLAVPAPGASMLLTVLLRM